MSTTTTVRKVGGSLMLTVPPVVIKYLQIKAGSQLDWENKGDAFIVRRPRKQPKYTIEELAARCKPGGRLTKEEREWIDAPRVGREIL